MPFKKSDKNINRNGRPEGAENSEKKELRGYLNYFLENNLSKLETEFNKLSGIQYVNMFTKLLEYSMPKLNRVTFEEHKNNILEMSGNEREQRIKELERRLYNYEALTPEEYTEMMRLEKKIRKG